MRTSEILDLAADTTERRGWAGNKEASEFIEGAGYTYDPWGLDGGPVCIEGALIAVIGRDQFQTTYDVTKCAAYRAVHEYLDLGPHHRLFAWNDAPERLQEEVVAVLRGAAAVERVKEEALQPQAVGV